MGSNPTSSANHYCFFSIIFEFQRDTRQKTRHIKNAWMQLDASGLCARDRNIVKFGVFILISPT